MTFLALTFGLFLAQNPAAFLDQGHRMASAQIEISQLARDRAADSQVRRIAERVLAQQTPAAQRLRGVKGDSFASITEGVGRQKSSETLPALAPMYKQIFNRLQSTSGAEFDVIYINFITNDLALMAALFKEQAREPENGNQPVESSVVKAGIEANTIAREFLPALDHLLQEANQVQTGLISPAP